MYKERIETCAQRIKTALEMRRMKQVDLCNLADVPKSSLSLYLSGAYEPKQDRIYNMARVLNVREAWLMGYDVPMEREEVKSSPSPTLADYEDILLKALRKVPEDKREAVTHAIQTVLDAYK